MARRRLEDRNVRKLSKGGTSYFVTIPVEYIRKLGWKKAQKLTVELSSKHLVIKDWKK